MLQKSNGPATVRWFSTTLGVTYSPESDPATMRVREPQMGKRRRTLYGQGNSPEQIVRKLRDAEAKLSNGNSVPEVARDLGISEVTSHRWRKKYGGMNPQEAKRLKELEKENARLKKLVAEQALDIDLLKEVNRGNFRARPGGREL